MNGYKIIVDPERIDKQQWSDFVFNHPYGNAFQTPEMYEVYQKTPLYDPIFIAVTENDQLLGILLALVQKEYPNPFGFISSRSIIWGGPLVMDNDLKLIEIILNEYDKIAKKKAIYSQFRNFWEQTDEKKIFEKFSYSYEEHLNILVDLSKSIEDLWKAIDSRKRTYINQAEKKGLKFIVDTEYTFLNDCYSILKSTYKKAKLPLPGLDFFKNLINFSDLISLVPFIVKFESKVISCFIGLCFKGKVYEFYVGFDSDYSKKNPGDLLLWKIFIWAKQNGFTLFDFGGAGKPNVPYGVRDYKKKFGGEMVEFGRYEKIHHPIWMNIAKTGFKIWQRVKF